MAMGFAGVAALLLAANQATGQVFCESTQHAPQSTSLQSSAKRGPRCAAPPLRDRSVPSRQENNVQASQNFVVFSASLVAGYTELLTDAGRSGCCRTTGYGTDPQDSGEYVLYGQVANQRGDTAPIP